MCGNLTKTIKNIYLFFRANFMFIEKNLVKLTALIYPIPSLPNPKLLAPILYLYPIPEYRLITIDMTTLTYHDPHVYS